MKTCPNCGEEWPSTASVCTCGTSLDSVERTNPAHRAERPSGADDGRSSPSTLQVVIAVIAVLSLIPSVMILARALPSGDGAPSAVDVPDNAPEAQPEQLPDRRERPSITCTGQDVPDDCMVWTFTLPGSPFANYTVDVSDTGVAVRTREDVWLLDPSTGDERWHHQEAADTGDALSVWLAAGTVVLEARGGFRTLDGATGEPRAVVTLEGEVVWMGADDQHTITVTRTDNVTIQGWDPISGDLRWTNHVTIPWTSTFVTAGQSAGNLLTVTVSRETTAAEVSELQSTTVDTSTGDVLDDPEPDLSGVENPAFRVQLEGTRLSAGPHYWEEGYPRVDWERDLDEQYNWPIPITHDHVALFGLDHGFLVVDARTGDDVAHVDLTNGRSRDQPWWRPWTDTQGILLHVLTRDAQHLVRLDLPLN